MFQSLGMVLTKTTVQSAKGACELLIEVVFPLNLSCNSSFIFSPTGARDKERAAAEDPEDKDRGDCSLPETET